VHGWKWIVPLVAILAISVGAWLEMATDCAAAKTGSTHEKASNDSGKTGAQAEIARGRYLTKAGDCRACHTVAKGKPFAGGLPLKTPFGVIYTPNITPDPETGIGKWSDSDFYNALHAGHGPHGTPLYPAFPYTFFTTVKQKDVLAIKAYLFSLPPVHYTPPPNKLHFPFSFRPLLYFWQFFYFHEGTFRPNPKGSALYNRGKYLVQGLGHCGACHTPRNWLGALKQSRALTGNRISGWYAPDISTDKKSTIRDMSVADIALFLRTGAAQPMESGQGPETAALGPMATVVHKSLSELTDRDLKAIATYLKQGQHPRALQRQPSKGRRVFLANCSGCHGANGEGGPPYIPALRRNPIVNAPAPLDVVRTILEGAPQTPAQRFSPQAAMPAFGSVLNNADIAAVATYIRSHWENNASAVTPAQVKALRQ
jgi:mono/diheme cytochrome c family protein